MKRLITLIVLGMLSATTYAQDGTHWIFGYGVHLEFTDTGIAQHKVNFHCREGASSINYPNSNKLLFYGDPNTVFNANGDTVVGNLNGHKSCNQGALFIRHPQDTGRVHYFTSDDIGSGNSRQVRFKYHHEISSTGEVLVKNDTLQARISETMSAVNHQNGHDVWISMRNLGDSLLFYLVKVDGLLCCPVVQKGSGRGSSGTIDPGDHTAKFSPDATLFSFATAGDFNQFEWYFDFNSESGKVDNKRYTGEVAWLGYEIANRNHLLDSGEYLLYKTSGHFYQMIVDLSKSWASVYRRTNFGSAGKIRGMNWASNDKIYFAIEDSSHIGVVNHPDTIWFGCDVDFKGVKLKYGKSGKSVPNFNRSIYYKPSIEFNYKENCNTNNYTFEGRDTFGATDYTWWFTSPIKGVKRRKTGQNISFDFRDTGVWQVKYIASNQTRSDTIQKKITIRPKWQPDFLGSDTFFCLGDEIDITLKAPKDMHCIHWNGDKGHNQADSFHISKIGTYSVKVTNKSFCTTYDTLQVRLKRTPPVPTIVRPVDSLICEQEDFEFYQWYLDSNEIQGAESRKHLPLENGHYQVAIRTESTCWVKSDSFLVDNIDIETIHRTDLKVFPIPITEQLNIEHPGGNPLGLIKVYDVHGVLVHSVQSASSRILLDAQSWASGVYYFLITDSSGDTFISQGFKQ